MPDPGSQGLGFDSHWHWDVSWENQQSAYAKTKTQISFAVTAKLIIVFVFAIRIVQLLYFLNPKFQASSQLLCLYSSVCVEPVRKPHCWFSHEVAHLLAIELVNSREALALIQHQSSENLLIRAKTTQQVKDISIKFVSTGQPHYNAIFGVHRLCYK